MSSANLTLTGKTGPNQQITAGSFPGVKSITFDIDRNVIQFKYGNAPERVLDFDYAITATVTYVITAGVATITIT